MVSDGALQSVPVSALPAPENPREPLIVGHEIVNLPSASVLAEIRLASAGRPTATREVAVLADPVFDSNDERVVMPAGNGPKHGPAVALPHRRTRRSASDVVLSGTIGLFLEQLTYLRAEAEAILSVKPPA